MIAFLPLIFLGGFCRLKLLAALQKVHEKSNISSTQLIQLACKGIEEINAFNRETKALEEFTFATSSPYRKSSRKIVLSNQLAPWEYQKLGIDAAMELRELPVRTSDYLEYHRDTIFKQTLSY